MKVKQEKNLAYYLRRAFVGLRRVVEIGLFTHTRCPSTVVSEALAEENSREQGRAIGQGADARLTPDARQIRRS